MKTIIILLLSSCCVFAEDALLLCKAGSLSPEIEEIGGLPDCYFKTPAGTVYQCAWWFNSREIPDSATHANIAAGEFLVAQLPAKSIAVSGIADWQAFLRDHGMVRCDAEGNEGGEE